MSIESNIFNRYKADIKKCQKYGFMNNKLEKYFLDNAFKAVININSKGIVTGTVYDIENNDEYLPLRLEAKEGSFVGKVKQEYENILIDIRNNCFIKDYFIYPQSNRITGLINKKYGNKPEFLWEKFSGSGIFRNPNTQKWYAAILDVDKSKLQTGKKGIIEVLDIKLEPDEIQELLKRPNFYPAYHMNKKYWITIILDDNLDDNLIMQLIDKSYILSNKSFKYNKPS